MINEKQEARESFDDILLDSAEIEALFDTMWKAESDTRDGYEQAAHWFCMGWAMATYLGKQLERRGK